MDNGDILLIKAKYLEENAAGGIRVRVGEVVFTIPKDEIPNTVVRKWS